MKESFCTVDVIPIEPPETTPQSVKYAENMEVAAFIGQLQADTGDRKGAAATLNRLIALSGGRFDPALLVAMIYTALGEIDTAFGWVDRAIERRTSPIYLLRLNAMFDGLKGDPRY